MSNSLEPAYGIPGMDCESDNRTVRLISCSDRKAVTQVLRPRYPLSPLVDVYRLVSRAPVDIPAQGSCGFFFSPSEAEELVGELRAVGATVEILTPTLLEEVMAPVATEGWLWDKSE